MGVGLLSSALVIYPPILHRYSRVSPNETASLEGREDPVQQPSRTGALLMEAPRIKRTYLKPDQARHLKAYLSDSKSTISGAATLCEYTLSWNKSLQHFGSTSWWQEAGFPLLFNVHNT